MGRFGNLFLTSGDPELRPEARVGEVVRPWLTNTANTRVFNVVLPGARMKLIGGDSGRYEHEELVDQVLLAPSERAVVEVVVERPGQLAVEHYTPDRTYRLATLTVSKERPPSLAAGQVEVLRRAPELAAERQGLDAGWPLHQTGACLGRPDGRPGCDAGWHRPGHLRLSDESGGDKRTARALP